LRVFDFLIPTPHNNLIITSCDKGGEAEPDLDFDKVKTAKFTFSVKGLDEDDIGHFVFSTDNAEGSNTF